MIMIKSSITSIAATRMPPTVPIIIFSARGKPPEDSGSVVGSTVVDSTVVGSAVVGSTVVSVSSSKPIPSKPALSNSSFPS